jgi:arylsulfatase
MAVYSAQIDEMDQGVGQIVTALKETGQFENTLILFMSDNGGCAEEIHRGGYDDWHEIGQAHTYESYGKPWANYSNTPFREYKHWVHEGGIATPLIAHWPQGITDPGRICRQPGHLIDIMPTLIELAGAGYPPPDSGADDVHMLPGRSLTPVFRGEPITREQIFWEHEANRALRRGKWKLVAKGEDGPWELYDMTEDRTETNDLADAYPDRVEEMAARWDAVARVTDVYPLFGDVPGLLYQERAAAASWKQSDA